MHSDTYPITRRVSIISGAVNLLLAIGKIIIGYAGYSQALITDGIHSLSDVISDGLVVFAAKASIQAPDEEHPYGHHRIETIAVIVIALVLLVVGISFLYPAITQLIHGTRFTQPSKIVLIMAVISALTNELLFHFCLRQGQKIQSSLLISNAWHNRSDALISLIVIASMIGGYIGWPFLDAVGAAIISSIIIYVAIKMLWKSGNELIDAATDPETIQTIQENIEQTPGVIAVHNLRTRHHGHRIFVDVHVQVAPLISVSEGHYIADTAEQRIRQVVPAIQDVAIHIDPEDDSVAPNVLHHANRQQIEQEVQQTLQDINASITIHQITLHYLEGELSAELLLHATTSSNTDLAEITHLERKIIANTALNHCHIYIRTS